MPRSLLAALLLLMAWMAMPSPSWAQTGNPTHDALAALSGPDRRGEFQRALRANGLACTSILTDYFAGLGASRTAYWDIRCREGAMFRVSVPAARWSQPAFLSCGAAQTDDPAGGPCFQPVTAATAAAGGGGAPGQDRICRASCGSQPAAAQQSCMAGCLSGGGLRVGAQAADSLPADTRFGAVYATVPPVPAWGFGNGQRDRLGVNRSAVQDCQKQAGRVPCIFLKELVNSCGAVAQAISRHPNAIVMTDDLGTQLLNTVVVGTGRSQAEAETEAMEQCRRAMPVGSNCRITASGC